MIRTGLRAFVSDTASARRRTIAEAIENNIGVRRRMSLAQTLLRSDKHFMEAPGSLKAGS